MRSLRTKRVRTEGVNLFTHPFQESVLEIQLQKHHKCLLQIQKNRLQKAAQLINEIQNHESWLSFAQKDKYMIRCFIVSLKAYLLHRQSKQHQALQCLNQANQIKNRHEKLHKMNMALTELIRSVIYCRLGKVQQCKLIIKEVFEMIKSLRGNSAVHNPYEKSYEKYNKIFILFLNMIILQLSREVKFEEVADIYREGHYFSQKILGRTHKLTLLMHRIIEQKIKKDESLQNIKGSKFSKEQGSAEKYQTIKLLNSKKKLVINEQRILVLSTKQRQMKRIYNDQDQMELSKLRLTKRDQKFYLRSLQKVKSIYGSSNGQYTKMKTDPSTQQRQQTFFSKIEDKNDYSRRRIKDIILRGRRLNKDMIYVCDSEYTRTQANADTISNAYEPIEGFGNTIDNTVHKQAQEEKVKVEDNGPPQELTFTKIALKVQQKQQSKQACQLI